MTLRPSDKGDAELLFRIYASTREEELAPLDWEAPVKEAFLRQQSAAQESYYHATFPQASYDLIVDGHEVLGRLYVHRGAEAWVILDIALLPRYRGGGVGTHLMEQVIAEADRAGRPVQIHVERQNPARRLYERLGFRQLEDQGVYLLMEHPPPEAGG